MKKNLNQNHSFGPRTNENNSENMKVECGCTTHEEKEYLNNFYSLSVDCVFDCLFNTDSNFYKEYFAANNFFDLRVQNWTDNSRKLEYNFDLGFFCKTKNIEKQKILKSVKNECFVVETEVSASGPLYADCVTTITKYCITKELDNKTRLIVNVRLDYKKKPSWAVLSIIESKTSSNMKSCYAFIDKKLTSIENKIN
ncbi:GRAM domain-containing 1A-like isoform X1 [Brachionus plicatilis]|uniref:GRAM domain-containing 1A-like isoform X1 n=1 Tax=Brachionus plicatilis TaxID=10195 RepID=A0A3M7SD22_BRAPC|nr:GRAM domain-containing 1A-like isoform X1 [Brachionus plicatilis]